VVPLFLFGCTRPLALQAGLLIATAVLTAGIAWKRVDAGRAAYGPGATAFAPVATMEPSSGDARR
jgi:hypothetical protein